MDAEKKNYFWFGLDKFFNIKRHREIKECAANFEIRLIFMWLAASSAFTAFAALVLLHSGNYNQESILGFAPELVLLIIGCLAILCVIVMWLIYVESKTDFILLQVKKDTNLLESKLDEIAKKLDKLLSDESSNQLSFQPHGEAVVLKDIRHLSVKATHSSETRTPSALDMSPIVPVTKFHSLSDNQLETEDQKSLVYDEQKSLMDEQKSLQDDHPCDQRQSADTSDDCVDVDLSKSSGVIADSVTNLEKSDIVL